MSLLKKICKEILCYVFIQGMIFILIPADLYSQSIPYQNSKLIKGIKIYWDTHKRHAIGSDNFQLTWAENDHQYGAWGDGGGFGGTDDSNRVSLGVVRIEGTPENYVGYNRYGHPRSSESEAVVKGKSWGMICVEGILYMWVHPDSHLGFGSWEEHNKKATLYHSDDKGATWKAADWSFTSEEGLVGGNILQAGKNYSYSTDNFIYHYFVQPNALPDADGRSTELHKPGLIYLARVAKDKILHKKSYEFFSGIYNNEIRWTINVQLKKPIFRDNNGVGSPIGITYLPVFKRYLLTTEHEKGQSGNLGIFESPTPWGPWSTVAYFSQSNHTEFGHDNSQNIPPNTFFWAFPSKWIEDDRKNAIMNFTGAGRGENNDSFNTVRIEWIID